MRIPSFSGTSTAALFPGVVVVFMRGAWVGWLWGMDRRHISVRRLSCRCMFLQVLVVGPGVYAGAGGDNLVSVLSFSFVE